MSDKHNLKCRNRRAKRRVSAIRSTPRTPVCGEIGIITGELAEYGSA
jgi:hypothetical protein